ncbi:MAG: hypothetical protein LQ338_007306, partial [Usnochroma carphineum]
STIMYDDLTMRLAMAEGAALRIHMPAVHAAHREFESARFNFVRELLGTRRPMDWGADGLDAHDKSPFWTW